MKRENQIVKGRTNKFSKGIYKLIDINFRRYCLVPVNFDMEAYKQAYKLNMSYPFSKPVY